MRLKTLRILCIALITACLATHFCGTRFSCAVDYPTVSTGSAACKPGDTVDIPVVLRNNTGFANMSIQIEYDDSVMTLSSSTIDSLGASLMTSDVADNPYNMAWVSADNITYNGTIATLHFVISDSAADGVYKLTISCYKGVHGNLIDGVNCNVDQNYNSINLQYMSGYVGISNYGFLVDNVSMTDETGNCIQNIQQGTLNIDLDTFNTSNDAMQLYVAEYLPGGKLKRVDLYSIAQGFEHYNIAIENTDVSIDSIKIGCFDKSFNPVSNYISYSR